MAFNRLNRTEIFGGLAVPSTGNQRLKGWTFARRLGALRFATTNAGSDGIAFTSFPSRIRAVEHKLLGASVREVQTVLGPPSTVRRWKGALGSIVTRMHYSRLDVDIGPSRADASSQE